MNRGALLLGSAIAGAVGERMAGALIGLAAAGGLVTLILWHTRPSDDGGGHRHVGITLPVRPLVSLSALRLIWALAYPFAVAYPVLASGIDLGFPVVVSVYLAIDLVVPWLLGLVVLSWLLGRRKRTVEARRGSPG